MELLLKSIDSLSGDFTPEKLNKIKAMFKALSREESEKNKRLGEQVALFSRLLMSISVSKKPQNGENDPAAKELSEKKSRQIAEVLEKILRCTK